MIFLRQIIMILFLGTLIASPMPKIQCSLFGQCSESLFDQVRLANYFKSIKSIKIYF
jgi:hypothetical protein